MLEPTSRWQVSHFVIFAVFVLHSFFSNLDPNITILGNSGVCFCGSTDVNCSFILGTTTRRTREWLVESEQLTGLALIRWQAGQPSQSRAHQICSFRAPWEITQFGCSQLSPQGKDESRKRSAVFLFSEKRWGHVSENQLRINSRTNVCNNFHNCWENCQNCVVVVPTEVWLIPKRKPFFCLISPLKMAHFHTRATSFWRIWLAKKNNFDFFYRYSTGSQNNSSF